MKKRVLKNVHTNAATIRENRSFFSRVMLSTRHSRHFKNNHQYIKLIEVLISEGMLDTCNYMKGVKSWELVARPLDG